MKKENLTITLSAIMILLLISSLYVNVKILKLLNDQSQPSPFLSPDQGINGYVPDPNEEYLIELSGVDGRGTNNLQGIFITITPMSDVYNPVVFGLGLHDGQRIIDPTTLTEEQKNIYLGRVVYNGHSVFFGGSSEMLARLLDDNNRNNFIRELLPNANQRQMTDISQDMYSMLPVFCQTIFNPDHPPLPFPPGNGPNYDNCESTADVEKAGKWWKWWGDEPWTGPKPPFRYYPPPPACKYPAGIGLTARLGLVGAAASAGYCIGTAIYLGCIAPGLECPSGGPSYDCAQRYRDCLSYYSNIGRTDLWYLCDAGKRMCDRKVHDIEQKAADYEAQCPQTCVPI